MHTIVQPWLTPFPEQTCPLLPLGQVREVSCETGMQRWLRHTRHTRPFPHLVPSRTRPGLMMSLPTAVVKALHGRSNGYVKLQVVQLCMGCHLCQNGH